MHIYKLIFVGRVYNHIKPASLVSSGCDYMLFKVGLHGSVCAAMNVHICTYESVSVIPVMGRWVGMLCHYRAMDGNGLLII